MLFDNIVYITLAKNVYLKNLATIHFNHRAERECWECHRETPHGRVNSISSVPNAKVPVLSSPVPDWLQ